MTDKTYNGWTNYATCRVNFEIFDGWDADDLDSLIMGDNTNLHDQLKEYVKGLIYEAGGGAGNLATDYAIAFLQAVNWHEIAKNMIPNYVEVTEWHNPKP